ncbi:MAG: DNRLRE domain-containing protein [Sporocytophaga sp.]|uniref:DNRLRE domain-containing protein n=1 Tax=Sporocytophaga sp. TaxID=2231183 RepID=UPI001B282848|nr:DNRLRE domain-containing protein [Sporocytophaga sp.]MBO9703227.1 DNRLRE domain-containing protein [Sporocytophaga sp.]
MIISKNPFIFPVLLIIFFLGSSCEHHCPLPQGSFERSIEIRQDINSEGDGDAYLNSDPSLENINGSGDPHNIVGNWTRFGDPARYRSYLKIDLSEIKTSEEIVSATLLLHTKPTGADGSVPDIVNDTHDPNNVKICLVTDSWEIKTLSWVNQPSFSELLEDNIIFTVPEDFPAVIGIDVTNLVRKIAGKNKTFNNNGFLFKMAPEEAAPPYRSFVFYSANAEVTKQPYLRVQLKSNY